MDDFFSSFLISSIGGLTLSVEIYLRLSLNCPTVAVRFARVAKFAAYAVSALEMSGVGTLKIFATMSS